MDKNVMTIEQVADYLQISVKSVYKLVRNGNIPATKVLNKWRFHRDLVDKYIFDGKKKARKSHS
ncbi:MAG: helix-turn-helix domain-containing protein [Thermodesulfobacteriota bacterium]|nr:helix-turn-helix domain-containing protein [Thermodesulfobacteriota bacterium]